MHLLKEKSATMGATRLRATRYILSQYENEVPVRVLIVHGFSLLQVASRCPHLTGQDTILPASSRYGLMRRRSWRSLLGALLSPSVQVASTDRE